MPVKSAREVTTFNPDDCPHVFEHLQVAHATPLRAMIEEKKHGWKRRAKQMQVAENRYKAFMHGMQGLLALLDVQPRQRPNAHKRLIAYLKALDEAAILRYCKEYNVSATSYGMDHEGLLEALADEMEAV